MRKFMIHIVVGSAIAMVGCEEDASQGEVDPISIIVDDSLYMAYLDVIQDSLAVNEAEIIGDVLQLYVSYHGGCQEHEFNLIASTGYEKSNPPRAHVMLTHDAKDDTCTDKINKALLFDLSPLKEFDPSGMGKFGVILIPLKDLAEPLRYEF